MEKTKEIFRGRKHYELLLNFLSTLKGNFKLLEIGAQDEVIRKHIPKNIAYSSLDMYGNPDYKVDLNEEKIPVKNNVFDILVCLETLEHTLYPKKIVEEIKRVTKRDGIFILSMPNDYNFWLRLNYFFGIKSKCTDEPFEIVSKFQHIHKPRVQDILCLFSSNFKIIKIIPLWQSRKGNTSDFFYSFDRIINFLAKIYPNLFARLIMIIAKNKMNLKENPKVGKILFAETKSKYYYPYQNFYNPLKRACKEIVSFDTRTNYFLYGKDEMNRKFLKFVEKEKPDCIFTWIRCDEFYLNTLLKIREVSPKTQVFLFFGDDDATFEAFSRYYIFFLDYGLIAQKKYVKRYYEDGIKNVSFVMGLDTQFFRPLNTGKKYDVTFIGLPKSQSAERYKLIKFLKDRGINIKLFGGGWENYSNLKDIYGGALEADKMVEVINQSKINLCFSKAEGGKTHLKGKVFEGGACKTFVLTEYCPDYLEMFEEGKEIVMFKDKKDLLNKINYYLKNEKEREEIANAAYKKVIKNYSLDNDLKKIFNKLFFKNKIPVHKPLPPVNKKIITLTKKDLDLDYNKLKDKLSNYDCIILSDNKCQNLEYREYLQAYSLEKTKKPISCCDYYLYTKNLGDFLRFSSESASRIISHKDFISLLDINQLMVNKDYFLKNLNMFKRAFNNKEIDFINKENTAFITFPLIRINRPILQRAEIIENVSEFLFIYRLFSLKSQGKLFLSFYPYILFLEILKGKKFILDALIKTLKRKDKKNKKDSLIK